MKSIPYIFGITILLISLNISTCSENKTSLLKLDFVDIKPKGKHLYSIIWLHGFGADGNDFKNIVPELKLNKKENIHFVFPHAPYKNITINNDEPMRAWYDIKGIELTQRVDKKGLKESVQMLKLYIMHEIKAAIPPENIIIAGYSQGGVIALYTALTTEMALGGVIALSCYLPSEDINPSDHSKSIPFFVAHGTFDRNVTINLGYKIRDLLQKEKLIHEWHEYPMKHQVVYEEIEAISQFINRIFK